MLALLGKPAPEPHVVQQVQSRGVQVPARQGWRWARRVGDIVPPHVRGKLGSRRLGLERTALPCNMHMAYLLDGVRGGVPLVRG
jgi:hypothetical protein